MFSAGKIYIDDDPFSDMTEILLTNDDGHSSVGFFPLLRELSKEFTVTAVAPSSQRSWAGKSISFHNEIELEKIKVGDYDGYSCSGTPADCVQIGLYNVLERKPGLVVSGINLGNNAGHGRILSSGTVG
ncbi:MAG: 5'/3'-nucleotidase SurE, partial [archaeon]|nr:5'/3'-nucleotidase SurE [archaeon]